MPLRPRLKLVLLAAALPLAGCGTSSSDVSDHPATAPLGPSAPARALAPTTVRTTSAPPLVPGQAPHLPGHAHLPIPDGGGARDGGVTDGATDAVTTGDANLGEDAGDAAVYGAWSHVSSEPTFVPDTPLLLTDGTVMMHGLTQASTWWRLTPDIHGDYATGTWTELAPMPTGYDPIFYASAVLADGRVVVFGGEYNEGADVETLLSALYDPLLDVWTPLESPNWTFGGDAPSVVLPNGVFMIGSAGSAQEALFDARTLTWSSTGSGKADPNSEEGWTLLPSGNVLTVDVTSSPNTELYSPDAGTWSSAGNVSPALAAPNPVYEIGPAVLRPNGTVFATGATGGTSIYGADGGWTPGPSFPSVAKGQLDIADGPAALLPNGDVLCVASAGDYQLGSHFFEFDGTNLVQVAGTPNAGVDSSYNVFLMVLPTGQIMEVDNSSDIELYTSAGAPDPSWAPTVTSAPTTVVRGTTYALHGTQFNGLSQGAAYGDDYQSATNYPLVRITNGATGHVFYGRTHDHSTMAVATGSADVSTLFEAQAATETGASTLVVVANGIASQPVAITVQ
jgi:hypothetical protein